jgi:hypothetical protein
LTKRQREKRVKTKDNPYNNDDTYLEIYQKLNAMLVVQDPALAKQMGIANKDGHLKEFDPREGIDDDEEDAGGLE